MTTTDDSAGKGDLTERHLLKTSLRLFRRKGFERTTMRDIAKAAGMSVGAAYYHYRSKEDLVLAYYRFTQDEHERLVREGLSGVRDPAERIRLALRSKLDLIADGRPYLGALFRFAGDPEHPLSVFGPATREIRERSIATFALALEGAGLSGPSARLAETGLWALHLALILRAVHDSSDGMKETYALADLAATLVGQATRLAQTAAAGPVIAWLTAALASIHGIAAAPAQNETTPGETVSASKTSKTSKTSRKTGSKTSSQPRRKTK